jgi:hypothetical protein
MSKLDPQKIPPELREVIPLAEKWGRGEEAERIELARQASDEELYKLLTLAEKLNLQVLEAWLDEPGIVFTEEGSAFICLGLAVDAAALVIEKRRSSNDPGWGS